MHDRARSICFFAATCCPVSKRLAPVLEALHQSYGECVNFVLVSVSGDSAEVADIWKAKGVTFPLVLDTNAIVAAAYAPTDRSLMNGYEPGHAMSSRILLLDGNGKILPYPWSMSGLPSDWTLSWARTAIDGRLVTKSALKP